MSLDTVNRVVVWASCVQVHEQDRWVTVHSTFYKRGRHRVKFFMSTTETETEKLRVGGADFKEQQVF